MSENNAVIPSWDLEVTVKTLLHPLLRYNLSSTTRYLLTKNCCLDSLVTLFMTYTPVIQIVDLCNLVPSNETSYFI